MPTAKQTAANRTNSQQSAGPRTTTGKAESRYNAVKHGIFATTQIMFDEKAEDLAELAAEYHQHHNPTNPNQRFLVDTLINNEWRLRRLRRVEAELWEHATNIFMTQNTEAPACTWMYLAKHVGGWSTPQIGRFYNGRHHTTVLYAIEKIRRMRDQDPSVDALLEVLSGDLRPAGPCSSPLRPQAWSNTLVDALAERILRRLTNGETLPCEIDEPAENLASGRQTMP